MPKGASAQALAHVLEVHEDALRRLRAQGHRRVFFHGPMNVLNIRLNMRASVSAPPQEGALLQAFQVIRPEALLALATVDHRIGKAGHVAEAPTRADASRSPRRCLTISARRTDHAVPPGFLHVAPSAQRPAGRSPRCCPGPRRSRYQKDETPPLAQRDNRVHIYHALPYNPPTPSQPMHARICALSIPKGGPRQREYRTRVKPERNE